MSARSAGRWPWPRPSPICPYNYAAPALYADGREAVLKLGVPHPELASEIAALRHYDGRGAVRLLEGDAQRGILLLERLRPGRMLADVDDDAAATRAAAQVMQTLFLCGPPQTVEPFATVERWASGLQRLRGEFDGGCGPFPARWWSRPERCSSNCSLPRRAGTAARRPAPLQHLSASRGAAGWPSTPRA